MNQALPYSKYWYRKALMYNERTPNGVLYHDELASINGVHMRLFKEPGIDKKDIRHAKTWLRNQRDVVSFEVVR